MEEWDDREKEYSLSASKIADEILAGGEPWSDWKKYAQSAPKGRPVKSIYSKEDNDKFFNSPPMLKLKKFLEDFHKNFPDEVDESEKWK